MKKVIINILTASITFITVSCTNDFIDLIPTSTVSVDILYKTDKDFSDALTATYNSIQQQYNYFYLYGDMRGDDSWQEIYKNDSQSHFDLFTLTSSDGQISSTWQRYYQAIFRANTVLSKIEQVNEVDVPNKARYIGEARFIRALAYFDLVRIFGNVPAVTTPVNILEAYTIPREPVENIYTTIIIPDFQSSETALPSSYGGNDIGRPTQGAAKAILGRVYLTKGDFQNAEIKLKEVTSMGYSLLPDYADLFDYSKNEHHSEYIFDIEYEQGMGEGSRFTSMFLPNFVPMNDFWGIIGAGEEQNSPTQELIKLFDDNDLRKEITIGIPGGFFDADSNFLTLPTNTCQTYTKKYICSVPARFDSRANWKVIRYADVLLMLAEAMNENGKTRDAISYLNQIRKRAGVSSYSDDMTQSETRDAIMLERRLELSFEGVRWFDLVRTGQAYNVMKDKGMQSYMTLFPLPLRQVQLINDPAILAQNPGYD
jgi:tetratricopeptide (TPR) repeat protein